MLWLVLLGVACVVAGAAVALASAANRWLDVVDARPPRPAGGRAVADRVGTAVAVVGLLCWGVIGAAVVAMATPPLLQWVWSQPPPLNGLGGGPFMLWFGVLFGVGGAVLVAAGLWMKVEAWSPGEHDGSD